MHPIVQKGSYTAKGLLLMWANQHYSFKGYHPDDPIRLAGGVTVHNRIDKKKHSKAIFSVTVDQLDNAEVIGPIYTKKGKVPFFIYKT